MSYIRVWNLNRSIKSCIKVPLEKNNLLKEFISEASKKLNINGETLVLEKDGTPIDESDALLAFSTEVFILLEKYEIWTSSSSVTFENIANSSIFSDIQYVTDSGESLISSQHSTVSPSTKSAEYTWIQFEIPWDSLTKSMIKECEDGIRSKFITVTLVHAVVNKMREIKKNIPSKAFKFVAKKMIDKYPQMFIDVDDDNIILGDGSASLFARLQDRNNYLNRPHKTKSSMENPIGSKKKKMNARAGCSHWDPPLDSGEENEENIATNAATDDPNFFKYLEKTYANQRKLINNDPPISEIKLKFPNLFQKEGIFWHFKKLTDCDIQQLPIILDIKQDLIIKFLLKKHIITDKDKANNTTSVDSQYIFLMKSISTYFKEKFEEFCPKVKDSISRFKPSTPSPVLAECNDKFYIYIDRNLLLNEGSTFMQAFQIIFSIYFNFNMEYPTQYTTTLEFVQRYFLKIHPDSGSKTKGKASAIKRKCILFITQLNSFGKELVK